MQNIFSPSVSSSKKIEMSHTKVWMSHLYSTFKGGRATFVSLTFLTSPRRELVRESLLKKKVNCTYNICKIFLPHDPMIFMLCYASPLIIRDVTKWGRLEFVEESAFFPSCLNTFSILDSQKHTKMSSLSHLISHSASKTKKKKQPRQQIPDSKAQSNRKNLYKPPYVSDWSYTIQKMCIKSVFHIHALNN